MNNSLYVNRNRCFGFTLLEVIVVILIISIIASIGMVLLNKSRSDSRNEAVISQMHEYQKALELYFASTGEYPSPSTPAQVICLADNPEANCISPVQNDTQVQDSLREYQTMFPYINQGAVGGPAYQVSSDGRSYTIYFTLEGEDEDCGGRAMQITSAVGIGVIPSSFTLCELTK